jgi:hypothetical protein
MAGYDEGVFEDGPPPPAPNSQEEANRRNQDPNGGWLAQGLGGGGAIVSDQFNQDVDRYRGLGEAATRTAPVVVNNGAAGQSRGLQMGALGLLRRQADGSAPSAAQIMSQRANQDAGRAAASQVASARGPGASIAAFGGANAAATGQAMAANAQNAGARAGEISRGQGAYASGAGAIRGQDIGMATTNAQLDAENRKLSEQQQQHYERQAFNVRNAEMQAANDAINQQTMADQQKRQAVAAEKQADIQKGKDIFSMGTGILSDPRVKTQIGSLGHMMRGRR